MSSNTARRIRRRSEGISHESPISDSFQSFDTSVGRNGLYKFLHKELRISSEVATFYCTSLTDNGYDDVSSLQDATENDLKELGVKIGHVRRIKRAVFSNCMRSEREKERDRSSGRTRRVSELHLIANEFTENEITGRTSLEGSLLSDYARQELKSREDNVNIDVADAKEVLIRKQAEKIATLEAKLAYVDFSSSPNPNDSDEMRSCLSRGGSADTQSKKLTPEERLKLHKERKLEENKYKEKSGKWEEPPPLRREKILKKKVTENNDLVLKLTSDASDRRKMEEAMNKSSKSSQKMRHVEEPRQNTNKKWSSNGERNKENLHVRIQREGDSSVSTNACHSTKQTPERQIELRKQRSLTISCETCGSSRDCEEDVDNPGVFYCKHCWDEYENDMEREHNFSHKQQVPATSALVTPYGGFDTHHALWIVHDNPQLGEKIIYSGPRQMECMIETKEHGKKNCVRIILGDIDFSGKVKNAGIGNVLGSENDQGTECIRIRNARGYCVDHNQVATRLSRDKSTYEFHLGDENAHLLTGRNATESVENFLKDCNEAIDVILDPQKDYGGWYPQKEACDGGRKIAPQFRSKGVGYIRLGDDMGQNGLAFLSSNACLSFLSNGSGTRMKPLTKFSPHPPAASKQSRNNQHKKEGKRLSRTTSNKKSPSCKPDPTYSSDESDIESEQEVQNVSEVLKQLQSPDMVSNMKWKDKAELISHLGKGASRHDGRHSRSHALNIIQDTLGGKNVNVHVVRSALIAVGMIGISMGGELVSQIAWKTILIETMKLLKSKQCGSVAKTVLAQLHGKCFTLGNSLELITHVLGLGMAASANAGKKSRKSNVIESPKPRKTSSNGGNSIEIIEWLAVAIERERNMDVINPMLERNTLRVLVNLFLSHADHRDQKCRKNALDGLMHCILYGVQKLGLELDRAMRMFQTLKETNQKAWDQIFQSSQKLIEEEDR